MEKEQKDKNRCWIEIHQVCGDCGRRIKHIVPIIENPTKERIKSDMRFIKAFISKYDMACKFCSAKNW